MRKKVPIIWPLKPHGSLTKKNESKENKVTGHKSFSIIEKIYICFIKFSGLVSYMSIYNIFLLEYILFWCFIFIIAASKLGVKIKGNC